MITLLRRNAAARTTPLGMRPLLRSRIVRAVGGLALLAAAFGGAILTLKGEGGATGRAPTVEGTWELTTMNGQADTSSPAPGVRWQRISLRGGKLRGESLVQPMAAAGKVLLPFPDESVDRVITAADETDLRVLWSGTYQIDEHRQVTLHVGKAVYFVRLDWRDGGQTMVLNQDIILTLPGTASYRRAVSAPLASGGDDLELFPGAVR